MTNFSNAGTVYDLVYLSSPVHSNDRNSLFYIKTKIDRETDEYMTEVIEYSLLHHNEKTWVANGHKNTYPAYQDNQLLFVSDKTEGNVPQVCHLNLENGEVTQLTYSNNPVTNVQWVGGTEYFTFNSQANPSQKLKWKEKQAPIYRYDTLQYQADGVGLLENGEENTLFMQQLYSNVAMKVSQQSKAPLIRKATSSSPDGEWLVFEKALEPNNPQKFDVGVFAYHLPTQKTQHITQEFETGGFGEASVSPDGKYLLMIGSVREPQLPTHKDVYLYDLTEETFTNLTAALEHDFSDHSLTDFTHGMTSPTLQWAPDATHFYVLASEYGDLILYEGDLKGNLKQISPNQTTLKEFTVSKDGKIYAFFSKYNDPVSLQVYDGEKWTRIALLDTDYSDCQFADYREIEYRAEDGGVVHGYLVLPPEFDEEQSYPFILNIHGGPNMMHASNFYHEVQHQAAKGYVVLLLNPRGSYGYGQDHVMGSYGKFGQKDYTDIMSAVDGVLADFPFIDQEELFVTGGSYGGYMTNWIVTHDHRFKSAVTQRCVSNVISMVGTSDIGYFFHNDMAGYDISRADKLWEASPLAYVQEVDTPLLIMHSLEDYRCPFEQAQQFYTGLKYFDKESELMVFPQSDHNLSRTGRPSYRVQRLQAMMEWFEAYK